MTHPRLAKLSTLLVLLALTAPALIVLVAGEAEADAASLVSATLPSARHSTAAIWDGTHAYTFGGLTESGDLDQIVRFNPATSTVTTMTAALPTPRREMSAVWAGSHAYLFGGYDNGAYLNQIVRYDPTTNTVTTMSATLPTARGLTSAVWDGTNAYIFAGYEGASSALNEIVRYNPTTNTVTTMSATFPTARHDTSAVWDGTNAYIFGGFGGNYQVVRYDPAANTVTTMGATLPVQASTSAAWDGTNAYVFGGYSNGYWDHILRYSPGEDMVTTMSATLPTDRGQTSAVWDGTNAYIFGGHDNGYLDQIVRYNPDTTAPVISATVSGVVGTDGWYRSDVTVSWSVTEPESAISFSSGCMTSTLSTDIAGTTFTCTATSLGGTSTASTLVKRDATTPIMTASRLPGANANGWNNDDVTVAWECTDAMSGVASSSAPEIVSAEGSNQARTGTCIDLAGNAADDTVSGISIDRTAPSASVVTPSASLGAFGMVWQAGDALSGLARVEVQEQSLLGLLGSPFVPICSIDLAGATTAGSVCGRDPSTGQYCYRVRVVDLAGNEFASLTGDPADPETLPNRLTTHCTLKL